MIIQGVFLPHDVEDLPNARLAPGHIGKQMSMLPQIHDAFLRMGVIFLDEICDAFPAETVLTSQ